MGIRRSLANLIANSLIGVAKLPGRQFFSYFADRVMNEGGLIYCCGTKVGDVKFWCPNEITWWRAETLLTKEPETIEWIDSFKSGDVYWDVGGNIGVYALYAAKHTGVKVLAFEPSPLNYFALCRNIEINGLSESLSAICLAFNDREQLEYLNMTSFEIGSAMASFGETKDFKGNEFKAVYRQAMMGISIDDFIARFNPLFPNHLKIDVDSIEGKIVAGAANTLADKRMKSISIELDDNRQDEINWVSESLRCAGFVLKHKKHSAMFENTRFSSANNYLFVRAEV